MAALLLCIFLGQFGGHRFYVGKIGTGIVWLLTFGFLGFAVIFDIIMICVGSFSDSDGLKVLRWGD
ncbi:MAG: TM2 domain-containing protein [Actinomycetaceae bacterium]|nr:TM2 domain-containing protein [Actinomycetaceae bacterium]